MPGPPKSFPCLRPRNPRSTSLSPFIEEETLHQTTVQPWAKTQEDSTQREEGQRRSYISEPLPLRP